MKDEGRRKQVHFHRCSMRQKALRVLGGMYTKLIFLVPLVGRLMVDKINALSEL
jgi:hypothetical protein